MRHFDNNEFDTAYQALNAPAEAPDIAALSLESLAALLVTFFKGDVPRNLPLTLIDAITPEQSAFASGFGQAYATFHAPSATSPIVAVGTLEYMTALTISMREGTGLHNISLTAIDNMTPEALAYVSGYPVQMVGQAPVEGFYHG